MDCDNVRQDLQACLEGLLPPDREAEIRAHLLTCQGCSEDLKDLEQTIDLVRGLDEVQPPPWLKQKVMARISGEEAPRRGYLARLFKRSPLGVPVAAAATVAVAVTAVLILRTMEPELVKTMPPAPAERPSTEESAPWTTPSAKGPAGYADERQEPRKSPPDANITRPGLPEHREYRDKGRALLSPEREAAPDHDTAADAGAGRVERTVPAEAAPSPVRGAMEQETRQTRETSGREGSGTAPLRGREGIADGRREISSAKAAAGGYERSVSERHANGEPRLVVTSTVSAGKRVRFMEERFDESGRRHGIHRAFDEAGTVTREVVYEEGKVTQVREFGADGSVRPGRPDQDWPWEKFGREE